MSAECPFCPEQLVTLVCHVCGVRTVRMAKCNSDWARRRGIPWGVCDVCNAERCRRKVYTWNN